MARSRTRSGNLSGVQEVTLDGQNGRFLVLRGTHLRDQEGGWSYAASLVIPEGTVTTEVYDQGNWLGGFMRELADNWQGFESTKEFASLEGQLSLACTHDGRGTVECRVTLRQPSPPEWLFEAVLLFGAGAHLDRLAGEVEALVLGTT